MDLKPFVLRFNTYYNGRVFSYNRRNLRFGSTTVPLTASEFEAVSYAHSFDDVSVPLGIIRAYRNGRIQTAGLEWQMGA